MQVLHTSNAFPLRACSKLNYVTDLFACSPTLLCGQLLLIQFSLPPGIDFPDLFSPYFWVCLFVRFRPVVLNIMCQRGFRYWLYLLWFYHRDGDRFVPASVVDFLSRVHHTIHSREEVCSHSTWRRLMSTTNSSFRIVFLSLQNNKSAS